MTPDQSTDTYDEQIDALIAYDMRRFLKLAYPEGDLPRTVKDNVLGSASHFDAWARTGQSPHCIFSNYYTGGCCCVVELCELAHHYPENIDDEMLPYTKAIEAGSNKIVPTRISFSHVFTREELEEIARLQRILKARWEDKS